MLSLLLTSCKVAHFSSVGAERTQQDLSNSYRLIDSCCARVPQLFRQVLPLRALLCKDLSTQMRLAELLADNTIAASIVDIASTCSPPNTTQTTTVVSTSAATSYYRRHTALLLPPPPPRPILDHHRCRDHEARRGPGSGHPIRLS